VCLSRRQKSNLESFRSGIHTLATLTHLVVLKPDRTSYYYSVRFWSVARFYKFHLCQEDNAIYGGYGSTICEYTWRSVDADRIVHKAPLELVGMVFSIDLIILKGQGLDVILGMSRMKLHGAVLDIAGQLVHLGLPVYGKVVLHLHAVSHIEASLHHMVELKLEDIHVVREFPDVFPDDLPGMPPERAIEFKIELQPGTTPISKDPYKMSHVELKE
jgi:hypothetical protein